jgi:sRNA-binding carbon storage regulator CsrA
VGIAAPADVAVDREEIHQRKIANPRAEVTHVHG